MTSWLISQVWPYALGLMALVWAYARIVTGVKTKERQKHAADEADAYQRTMKEMGRVEIVDDPDDAQRWLRERGKQ